MSRTVRDDYLQLVKEFPLTSIKSEEHLDEAQKVMHRLLAKPRLKRGELEYLDALSNHVIVYENAHHAVGAPSDADLLRHLMEARGVSQSELHRETKIAISTISQVLSGKRAFTKDMIGKLAVFFKVEKGLFVGNF
jgi:HTH-type transcriptional regulator/antitoxin HigA